MRFVVTGGLGYVGGRLCKHLVENGHEVTALSRQAGSLPAMHLPSGLAIAHPDDFLRAEMLTGVDTLVHLASLNEVESLERPSESIDVNIAQTLRWLEVARRSAVGQFIYFSTAHVYGKPLAGFFSENSFVRPVHPYAITHLCAEQFVQSYSAEYGMNTMIFRLTNAIGAPAFPTANRWTLLVNDLCRMAVRDGVMQLHSDGTQLRDFICLLDVCRAVEWAVGQQLTGLYNLGSGQSKTVWSMAVALQMMAEKVLQRKIPLARKHPGPGDPASLAIDTSRLLATGFDFAGSEEEELVATLNYFVRNP